MEQHCSKCGHLLEGKLWDRLTPRDKEIAELLIEGFNGPAIAAELNMASRTVKAHLHKMFQMIPVDKRYLPRILLIRMLWEERYGVSVRNEEIKSSSGESDVVSSAGVH